MGDPHQGRDTPEGLQLWMTHNGGEGTKEEAMITERKLSKKWQKETISPTAYTSCDPSVPSFLNSTTSSSLSYLQKLCYFLFVNFPSFSSLAKMPGGLHR